MNLRWSTGALVVVNLALAGAVVWVRSKPAPQASSDSPVSELAVESAPDTQRIYSTNASSTGAQGKPIQFTWRAVSDRDLKKYIAKLRMVHCPEETIQDIILAEVDRLYLAKEAALGFRREFVKVWEATEPTRERDFEKAAKFRQLRVEKRNLIYELLGIDVPGEIPSLVGSNFNTAWEQALALLPLEKRGPVRAVQDHFWEQTETLRKRLDNLLLPEDADEYRKLRAERISELKKILTPKELEEVEIRTSTTGNNLKNELSAFLPTESEFRELFRIKRDLHETTYLPGQIVGDDEGKRAQEYTTAQLKAEEQIKATLGETRYAEYQRAQDTDFQQLTRITTDAGLARDVAIAAYNVQKQIQVELQQRLQDPNLPAAQRQAAMNQVLAESGQKVHQLVGDTAFQQILQRFPGRFGPMPPQFRRTNGDRVPGNIIQPVQDNLQPPAP